LKNIAFDLAAATPMFMSGADQEHREFRVPAIKGCIRYWFRAIYPQSLPDDEKRLFGSTDARSPFSLRAKITQTVPGEKGDGRWNRSPVAYLGYGVIVRDKHIKKSITQRNFFDSGSQFSLEFIFRTGLGPEDKYRILKAFWALCMFGGLGSRSRRGFGSIKINGVKVENSDKLPENLPFYFENRQEFINAAGDFVQDTEEVTDYPEHTAFSDKFRLIVTRKKDSSMIALENIGKHFQNYRSYYGEKNLTNKDHDLMLDFLKNKKPQTAPSRAAFGLPHNYFFTKSLRFVPAGVDLLENDGKTKGRRGSPLFIHIQEFRNGTACGVITFLPARLIPEGKNIRLSGNGKTADVAPPDFMAVEKFMDYLKEKGV